MDWNRKKKLMWRWSLVTGGVIALFWMIWYLVIGKVPVVTPSIKMTENWSYILPFGISRWWDILIGPIWPTLLILIFTAKRIREDKDLLPILSAGLVFGLFFGLIFDFGFNLAISLILGLGLALLFGLVIGLFIGLMFAFGIGLSTSLILGPIIGLAIGLGVGFGASLGAGLNFGLGWIVKNFRPGLAKTWKWLLAQE